jgi:hypothetical protein
MSLRQLPVGRQRAWLLDGEGEGRSRTHGAAHVRWSARRICLWGIACAGGAGVFIAAALFYLMIAAPEATSYLG